MRNTSVIHDIILAQRISEKFYESLTDLVEQYNFKDTVFVGSPRSGMAMEASSGYYVQDSHQGFNSLKDARDGITIDCAVRLTDNQIYLGRIVTSLEDISDPAVLIDLKTHKIIITD